MLVIATGSSGGLFNVNEMRIKVSSSYPSGHIEVRCPLDKKNISGQKRYFDEWKAVAKAIYKKTNSTRPRLSNLDRWLLLF